MTTNMKNNTFAIPVAADTIPPNPKMAAMIAITKNVTAQFNMCFSFNDINYIQYQIYLT